MSTVVLTPTVTVPSSVDDLVKIKESLISKESTSTKDTSSIPTTTTPLAPPVPGARMLGKYIMLETLGEGGFSKVKLGIDTSTKEKVALKMLKKDKLSLSSASIRKQVEREISAMSKIVHPNVLRLKEVDWSCEYVKRNGKKREIILVVLELATGGELFEFLNFTGPFEETIARTYFHELIAGVGHCHAAGVAHRDLKPENLLLDSNFVLKLADFGFSNVFSSTEKLMFTECGTPGYMAPEMIKNTGYDATISDIWACGVILFIMLAGFPPFQKPNVSDWWFQKLATNKHHLFWQAHSRNAYFSDHTKDFLNKILTPDPTKRITIADMKKHPWFTGPTIPQPALVVELTRRKTDVDAAKAREKAEKKKRAEAESTSSTSVGTGGSLSSEVMRGEDYDMPVDPPSMWSSGPAPETTITDLDSGSSGSLGGLTIEEKSEDKSEKKKSPPPTYDPSSSMACYSSFESKSAPSTIMNRIDRAVTRLGAHASIEEDRYRLKASILTDLGSVVFTAQCYSDVSSSSYVVEFRRRQGDSLHFFNFFNDIRDQLTDIITSKPSTSTETSTTTSLSSTPLTTV